MSRGRKLLTKRDVLWSVHISQEVASQTDILLLDPSRSRVRYGARKYLINYLLRKWLEDVKAGREQVPHLTDIEEDE